MTERVLMLIKEIEEGEPPTSRGRLKWCNGVHDDQVVITGNRDAIFRLGCELVKASALDDQRIEELKHFFDESSKIKNVVIAVIKEDPGRRDAFRTGPGAIARIRRAIIRGLRIGEGSGKGPPEKEKGSGAKKTF